MGAGAGSQSTKADIRCGVMVRSSSNEDLPRRWSRSSNPRIGAADGGDDYGRMIREVLVGFVEADV